MGESIVKRVIAKSEKLWRERDTMLDLEESILSGNLVTDHSLNFPIFQTCQPTKVCVATCYFAKGMTAFPDSLRKQLRLYRFVKKHPEYAAYLLATMYFKNGLTFLRWNGGGDLFPESVECLNILVSRVPQIIVWIPTRKLELAAQIIQSPSVFVNISLDRSSMEKLDRYLAMPKASDNFFFSYQYDRDETTDPSTIDRRISLLYLNGDREPKWLKEREERICPRTFAGKKDNTCVECRRCFNGYHVNLRKDLT